MEKFRDKYDHEWSIDMDLGLAEQVEAYDFRNQCPRVQLMPPSDDFFTHRITDAKVVFGIVWICIQDQIQRFNDRLPLLPEEERKLPSNRPILNELDFAKRLSGASIGAMKTALWGELPNFFPEAATSLRTLMTRFSRIQEVANVRLGSAISRLTDERLSDSQIEQMVDQQIRQMESDADQKIREMIPQPTEQADY